MGDISKNLSRREFACQCGCGFDTVDFELAQVIQATADHFAKKEGLPRVSVFINSGCRCEKHNAAEGGSEGSKHKLGIAADYRIGDVTASDVADYLEKTYPDKYGIGRYNGRTHIDVRSGKARWDMRAKKAH